MSRRPSRTVLAVVAAVIALAGCGPTQAPSSSPSVNLVPKPQVSSDFVTRLDGSTATIPLGSAVMTALTGSDEGMVFNKTDMAYENLIRGDKDLILVTYPSEEEFQMAVDAGVELDVIPVVKDALVFLANTGNTVDNLTQDQVKDIYTGTTTNWSQVGGADAAITPYQRQVNSGSQTLFLKLAMGDVTPMDAPPEMRPGEMSALVDMIADYDNSTDALGYTMFYYATQMYLKDTVKLLSIDGIQPSAQTISDESFPYLTYYYAVVRKDSPADSDARKVIDWMLGDEAQQLASQTNYVPMDPRNIQPPEPAYGYFGSTKENTTQSSGTGGSQMKSVQWESCYDDTAQSRQSNCMQNDNGYVVSFSYDGEEAMSDAVMQQISEHPLGCHINLTSQSFTIVDCFDAPDEFTSRIISSAGTTMVLSDFFYDSVNYISYINQNLFNETTNTEYYKWLHADQLAMGISHDPPVGFTGIPNDYSNFGVNLSDGLEITFTFPEGNPFFPESLNDPWAVDQQITNEVSMGLFIPSDLSPYGRIAATTWTQNAAGQIYPVLTTTSAPSASDNALNGKILAQAAAHPKMACFRTQYGAERISLLGYVDPAACQSPSELPHFPTLVGQWAFATWDDAPMTVADLPSTWRTQFMGALVVDGGDCFGTGESECLAFSDITSLSSAASVRSVWAQGQILNALVDDQGTTYVVSWGM